MQFLNPGRAVGGSPETEIAMFLHTLAAGPREADGHGPFAASDLQPPNDVRRAAARTDAGDHGHTSGDIEPRTHA